MPEGHTVHRVAARINTIFAGHSVRVSSPQGRFEAGAARLDGHRIDTAWAVGKHLFVQFSNADLLHVHLGIYGAWDFMTDSLGAPRRARERLGDRQVSGAVKGRSGQPGGTGAREARELTTEIFPPEPVGQVRLRLVTSGAVADLRGPMTCELVPASDRESLLQRFGPDPLGPEPHHAAEQRFISAVARSARPIAVLLMDQRVVSGIGNVYRAELLFRARLDPYQPGQALHADTVRKLWRDWVHLLKIGVLTGVMLTRNEKGAAGRARGLNNIEQRHWVYRRAGLPCRVCVTHIRLEMLSGRKLYWCPRCQVPDHGDGTYSRG